MLKRLQSPLWWGQILGALYNLALYMYPGQFTIPNVDLNIAAQVLSWFFIIAGGWADHTLTWATVLGWLGIITTGPTAEDKQADKIATKVVAILVAQKLIAIPDATTGDHRLPAATKDCEPVTGGL